MMTPIQILTTFLVTISNLRSNPPHKLPSLDICNKNGRKPKADDIFERCRDLVRQTTFDQPTVTSVTLGSRDNTASRPFSRHSICLLAITESSNLANYRDLAHKTRNDLSWKGDRLVTSLCLNARSEKRLNSLLVTLKKENILPSFASIFFIK